ncbi:hypothetical protein LXH13_00925 [Streptomyces spinosirectus]|uniref:hypothetical protein n=1 Tax=Streptomyces TaxID=1883 RepID=UPI000FFED4C7|nr:MULTISPECIES: hypothetical protein [Streptomyces]MBY8339596.1 hypothetical protein [Streptomyces plumbidurans]UIR15673.1 hypothetical protein LXH13_00925 [Streptomyces spinosirectus]
MLIDVEESKEMTELLDLALAAHGGLERWREVAQLQVKAKVDGSTWASDGVLARTVATIETRAQRLTFEPFGAPDRSSNFAPDRVEILNADGSVYAEREAPRSSFAPNSAWDQLHKAYFAGYALWNYMSTPFLFAGDGFQVDEIDPWQENGETWRRLRVQFPDHIATHSPVQVFYFDAEDHLLRRQDYNVDVLGDNYPAAHYKTDHRTFGGLTFPTRHRVVPRNPDNTSRPGPIIVAIDIESVSTSTSTSATVGSS